MPFFIIQQVSRLVHGYFELSRNPSRSSQWRNNERDGISNHQRLDCLLNALFRRRSKKTSKARVTGLCEGNSPVTGEFPAQKASNAENVSIWWRRHDVSHLFWIMSSVVKFYVPQRLQWVKNEVRDVIIYHNIVISNDAVSTNDMHTFTCSRT